MAACDDYDGIVLWGNKQLDFLRRLQEYHYGIPCADWLRVVMMLVEMGYVRGASIKEPAVKSLNAVIGSLLCDALLDDVSGRRVTKPILVYENNEQPTIYEDTISMMNKSPGCFSCHLADTVD